MLSLHLLRRGAGRVRAPFALVLVWCMLSAHLAHSLWRGAKHDIGTLFLVAVVIMLASSRIIRRYFAQRRLRAGSALSLSL